MMAQMSDELIVESKICEIRRLNYINCLNNYHDLTGEIKYIIVVSLSKQFQIFFSNVEHFVAKSNTQIYDEAVRLG